MLLLGTLGYFACIGMCYVKENNSAVRLRRLSLLLFHMYTKDQPRRDLKHTRHDYMVLEGVIKNIGSLGGVFLILLKKGKVLGREGQFHGPGLS